MSAARPLRVLHGPVNVGNQPWTLSRAERHLGLSSDLVVNYGTWLGYPADRTLSSVGDRSAASRLKRAVFALTAPLHYDVVHYYFGRSFMLWDDLGAAFGQSEWSEAKMLADVRLARRAKRRLFMTLQGCDARHADVSNRSNPITMCREDACPAYGVCRASLDNARRLMIERLLPMMDRVFYLNPELGHVVPQATFMPYANVDPASHDVRLPEPGRKPRIIHAPSNGAIKGTPMILAALERLKSRFDFELVLVENTPHTEAMKIYASADMAIDQILAGWYGGFAVEMMAMGKPVAAYIREEDRAFVPPAMWDNMPVLRLDPRTLDDDLAAILANPDALRAAGAASREYVERWHNPMRTARVLARIYADPSVPFDLADEAADARVKVRA